MFKRLKPRGHLSSSGVETETDFNFHRRRDGGERGSEVSDDDSPPPPPPPPREDRVCACVRVCVCIRRACTRARLAAGESSGRRKEGKVPPGRESESEREGSRGRLRGVSLYVSQSSSRRAFGLNMCDLPLGLYMSELPSIRRWTS